MGIKLSLATKKIEELTDALEEVKTISANEHGRIRSIKRKVSTSTWEMLLMELGLICAMDPRNTKHEENIAALFERVNELDQEDNEIIRNFNKSKADIGNRFLELHILSCPTISREQAIVNYDALKKDGHNELDVEYNEALHRKWHEFEIDTTYLNSLESITTKELMRLIDKLEGRNKERRVLCEEIIKNDELKVQKAERNFYIQKDAGKQEKNAINCIAIAQSTLA